MLKDVTLGQYFPGETSVHKLDPRTKLVLVIVYIVALFLAKGAASYALVAACLLAVIGISKIPEGDRQEPLAAASNHCAAGASEPVLRVGRASGAVLDFQNYEAGH